MGLITRASRNDQRVLVRGVVSTLMLLAGEVPMHATVSMGGGGVIKDGCIGRSDVVGCCIDVRPGWLILVRRLFDFRDIRGFRDHAVRF